MSLLKWLSNISPFRGLPIDDKGNTSTVSSVSGETVQLYYYNSGTLTADAGQAAGTVVVGVLAYDNVKNAEGTLEATSISTSLSFTSTALTSEVGIGVITPEFLEALDESKASVRAAAIGAKLSNGQYFVDYTTGTIYGKKASNTTTLTSTAYKVRQQQSSATIAANSSVNVNQIGGSSVTAGAGAVAAGTQRVTLASNDPAVTNTTDLPNVIGTDGAAGPSKAVSVAGTDGSGNLQELLTDTSGNLAVKNIPSAVAANSASLFADLGANATANVKSSAGIVMSIQCHNLNAATRYFQIHNTTTTPAGGAVPLYSVQVPTVSTVVIGADFFGPNGLYCSTGIAFAFSTTEATYTAGTNTDQMTFVNYK